MTASGANSPQPKAPNQLHNDLGTAWTGKVPTHWQVWKLSHAYGAISSGTTPASNSWEYYDGTIPWVNTSELQDGQINETSRTVTSKALQDHSALKIYPPGTLLIALYGATIGKVGILGIPATVNQACCALVNPISLSSKFTFYWLIAHRQHIIGLSYGGGQPNISQGTVRSLRIPAPPLPEQRAIAAFLDHKTAQIDGLIAEKRRLIELLQEKRNALISHAVTKGLDPDARMKTSGSPILGSIPKDWATLKLKHCVESMISGPFGSSLTKDQYTRDGYRVYGQEQVIPGDFSVGDYFIPEEKYSEMSRYAVRPGDVLVSCVGTFGKVAVVPEDIEPGIINPRLIRLSPQIDVIRSAYLELVLKSRTVFEQLERNSRGGTMGIINLGLLSEVLLPVPPIWLQEKILEYVAQQSNLLGSLVKAIEMAIKKLREYRTALISAAVTGKIDVGEWRV